MKKTTILMVISITFLLLVTITQYSFLTAIKKDVSQETQWVVHTYEVINTLTELKYRLLLKSSTDEETMQNIDRYINTIKMMVSDNPMQVEKINEIEKMFSENPVFTSEIGDLLEELLETERSLLEARKDILYDSLN